MIDEHVAPPKSVPSQCSPDCSMPSPHTGVAPVELSLPSSLLLAAVPVVVPGAEVEVVGSLPPPLLLAEVDTAVVSTCPPSATARQAGSIGPTTQPSWSAVHTLQLVGPRSPWRCKQLASGSTWLPQWLAFARSHAGNIVSSAPSHAPELSPPIA